MSALARRKQWEQGGTECERAAESGVNDMHVRACARDRKYEVQGQFPRVFPGFPDFYLTHKQCDRDGAARGLTGAPRDYINNNDLLCKQLQVITQRLAPFCYVASNGSRSSWKYHRRWYKYCTRSIKQIGLPRTGLEYIL